MRNLFCVFFFGRTRQQEKPWCSRDADVQIVRYTWRKVARDIPNHPVTDSQVSVQCSECQSGEISDKCGVNVNHDSLKVARQCGSSGTASGWRSAAWAGLRRRSSSFWCPIPPSTRRGRCFSTARQALGHLSTHIFPCLPLRSFL